MPAGAQTVIETTPGPEIVPRLRLGTLGLDGDGDGVDDRFLPVTDSSAEGGNASWLRLFISPPERGDAPPVEITWDTARCKEIRIGPTDPEAALISLAPDDGPCCPGLRETGPLDPENLPPA